MRTVAALHNIKPNMTKSNSPTIVSEKLTGTHAEYESHLSQNVLKIQNRPSCIRAFATERHTSKHFVISAHVRYGKVEHLNQTFFCKICMFQIYIQVKGFHSWN